MRNWCPGSGIGIDQPILGIFREDGIISLAQKGRQQWRSARLGCLLAGTTTFAALWKLQ